MDSLTIVQLIIYSISVYGLAFGIVESKLVKSLRDYINKTNNQYLISLFTCYHCLGFWCGLFLSYFFIGIRYGDNFILALYTSGICYLLYRLEEYLYNKCIEKDQI